MKRKLSFDPSSKEVHEWRRWMAACNANGGRMNYDATDEFQTLRHFCKDEDDIRNVLNRLGSEKEMKAQVKEWEENIPELAERIKQFRKIDKIFRKKFP